MRNISILVVLLVFGVSSLASAGYREIFEKEFLSKPWGAEIDAKSACLECHTSDVMSIELQRIPQDWKMSWHYQNDVSCHDCHGGDSRDANMAMSHKRGFVGLPGHTEVPEFCGKCHIGILKNYLESGHGKALKATGEGPNCVTCHGSHNIQKVSIELINVQLCSKCHSYERAMIMKQAIFEIENKIEKIEKDLNTLRAEGVYPAKEDQRLFDAHAKFRTLFHTIDVPLIKNKTDAFAKDLDIIQSDIEGTFSEISFRKKFSTMLMLIFAGTWVVLTMLYRSYKD